MIEFEKPNIECVETDDKRNYAKFICEPLERGYGMTIGNSLRRILLSSLPGAAITSVKINGVVHEFSTVQGVVEDVPELIINLKNVRLKVFDNEEKIIRIDFKCTLFTNYNIYRIAIIHLFIPFLYRYKTFFAKFCLFYSFVFTCTTCR